MKEQPYSRAKQQKGRKYFAQFEFINVISFSLLAGNILTLLVLQLGASDLLVGILNSFIYLSFFFMPFGRKQVKKIGVVKNFGKSWTIRYSAMFPVILAPLLWGDKPLVALPLIFTGYLGFQIFRGIGIVSINPIMKELSNGKDQGNFLSRMQILVHSGSLLANIGVAVLIGPEAPLWRYSLSIGLGMVLGIFGAKAFMNIPEPPLYNSDSGTKGKNKGSKSLLLTFQESLRKPEFRRFLFPFTLLIFFSSMYRPFLTVFAKQYYQLPDNTVLLFNLVGSLGAISMGFINRTMLDKVGAKPMIMIWTGILSLSSIVALFAGSFSGLLGIVFLSFLFFFSLMGSSGSETSSQGYFYTIMPKNDQIELGILYYLLMGIAGALGSILGGWILDSLKSVNQQDLQTSFFWFFTITSLGLGVTLVTMFRMETLSGRSVGEALSVLLSLRDWRAMSLVRKLDSSKSINQEQALLQKLRNVGSQISQDEVIDRLKSPLFRLRREALNTLFYLPYTNKIQRALIELVENNEFATSYPAARILGQRGTKDAIPVLRKALSSPDDLLCANAAAALGEYGDQDSRKPIENLVMTNPSITVRVYGSMALGMLKKRDSIPPLYRAAFASDFDPTVTQEAAFSIASIMGLEESIHRFYPEFLKKPEEGMIHLIENLGGTQSDEILALILPHELETLIQSNFELYPNSKYWIEANHIISKPTLKITPPFKFLMIALTVQGLKQNSGDRS